MMLFRDMHVLLVEDGELNREIAETILKEYGFVPDQVQDFYPTPGTLSTCMYYTEMDPLTMEPVYVAKTAEEKKMQRALIHFHKNENRKTVEKALAKAGKQELIPLLSSQRLHTKKGK